MELPSLEIAAVCCLQRSLKQCLFPLKLRHLPLSLWWTSCRHLCTNNSISITLYMLCVRVCMCTCSISIFSIYPPIFLSIYLGLLCNLWRKCFVFRKIHISYLLLHLCCWHFTTRRPRPHGNTFLENNNALCRSGLAFARRRPFQGLKNQKMQFLRCCADGKDGDSVKTMTLPHQHYQLSRRTSSRLAG